MSKPKCVIKNFLNLPLLKINQKSILIKNQFLVEFEA